MATAPARWDRNSVDRLFTELVGEEANRTGSEPAEVAGVAKQAVLAMYASANPGGQGVPLYLRRLAEPPESDTPSDLGPAVQASDLDVSTARTAETTTEPTPGDEPEKDDHAADPTGDEPPN